MGLVYTEDSKRALRLHSMLWDEGTLALRKSLYHILAGADINIELANSTNRLKIENALSKGVIKKGQFDVLYNNGPVDIGGLDVTLLTFLIRYLHPHQALGHPVWRNPAPSDTSLEADITRLRDFRNARSHVGSGALREPEFLAMYSELKTILCRIAATVGGASLTVVEMETVLEKKKSEVFDAPVRPEQRDITTSVSSSLDDMTSTTGSLNKKRKVSIRRLIKPFVYLNAVERNADESKQGLPKRKISKHAIADSKTGCSCKCVNGIRSSPSLKEPDCIFTSTRHSQLEYRCKIDSMTFIGGAYVLVSDYSHGIIQAIQTHASHTVSEFQCPYPRGMCNLNENTAAVLLERECKILTLAINEENAIEQRSLTEFKCDNWHIDIKTDKSIVYVLCRTGDIHMINAVTKVGVGHIKTNVSNPCAFEISDNNQPRFYISTNKVLYCYDWLGACVWKYDAARVHAPKATAHSTSFTGIALYKKRLFIALWDSDEILELSTGGKKGQTRYHEVVQRPWALCAHQGSLYISQYMSDIENGVCREIIGVRL